MLGLLTAQGICQGICQGACQGGCQGGCQAGWQGFEGKETASPTRTQKPTQTRTHTNACGVGQWKIWLRRTQQCGHPALGFRVLGKRGDSSVVSAPKSATPGQLPWPTLVLQLSAGPTHHRCIAQSYTPFVPYLFTYHSTDPSVRSFRHLSPRPPRFVTTPPDRPKPLNPDL